MQGRLKRSYRIASELARNDEFEGSIELSDLPRLGEQVIDTDSAIVTRFRFGRNDFGHPMISGQVGANLKVECQRCLEAMSLPIDQPFELLIDASESDTDGFALDSVYTQDGYLDVFETVEDELLLALPIIQMHENLNCNKYWKPEDAPTVPAEPVNNPFAVLGTLKGTD